MDNFDRRSVGSQPAAPTSQPSDERRDNATVNGRVVSPKVKTCISFAMLGVVALGAIHKGGQALMTLEEIHDRGGVCSFDVVENRNFVYEMICSPEETQSSR
ncbi:hypothetical protein [Streptomyces phaeochromogenes]